MFDFIKPSYWLSSTCKKEDEEGIAVPEELVTCKELFFITVDGVRYLVPAGLEQRLKASSLAVGYHVDGTPYGVSATKGSDDIHFNEAAVLSVPRGLLENDVVLVNTQALTGWITYCDAFLDERCWYLQGTHVSIVNGSGAIEFSGKTDKPFILSSKSPLTFSRLNVFCFNGKIWEHAGALLGTMALYTMPTSFKPSNVAADGNGIFITLSNGRMDNLSFYVTVVDSSVTIFYAMSADNGTMVKGERLQCALPPYIDQYISLSPGDAVATDNQLYLRDPITEKFVFPDYKDIEILQPNVCMRIAGRLYRKSKFNAAKGRWFCTEGLNRDE